jgi:iron complex transport system substrate-binding protein
MIRVVSLLPSATEIVCALGFKGALVGRSHECDYPPEVEKLPVLTAPHFAADGSSREIDHQVKALVERGLSLYKVDTDRLAKLQPDVIVTQSQCDVCAVSEKELAAALSDWVGKPAQIVSLQPDSLAAIWEDFRGVGKALGDEARADQLIYQIRGEISQTKKKIPLQKKPPKVLCLEWLDPPMTAGNWMPELVEMAGGKNLLSEAGKHSPYQAWEEIFRVQPELILIMPCGFDIMRSKNEMGALISQSNWHDLPAVRHNQIYITDGNQYFNRPGPRLLDSFHILTEIFHPDFFPPRHCDRGWIRFSP